MELAKSVEEIGLQSAPAPPSQLEYKPITIPWCCDVCGHEIQWFLAPNSDADLHFL
jgi:hypothetical protein